MVNGTISKEIEHVEKSDQYLNMKNFLREKLLDLQNASANELEFRSNSTSVSRSGLNYPVNFLWKLNKRMWLILNHLILDLSTCSPKSVQSISLQTRLEDQLPQSLDVSQSQSSNSSETLDVLRIILNERNTEIIKLRLDNNRI